MYANKRVTFANGTIGNKQIMYANNHETLVNTPETMIELFKCRQHHQE